MKFKELIEYLDEIYPRSLGLPGDNDGVEVCTDYNIEIGGVLLALDITLDAIEYAKAHAYNCILSHHAMIHAPITKFDVNLGAAVKKAAMLAKHDICAASFHTRLDSVPGGVNDCLLATIGISSQENLICDNTALGRICYFEQDISVAELAGQVDKSLKQFFKSNYNFELAGCVKFNNGGHKIKKLAVIAGSAMSFIEHAVKAGADTYLTGDGKFYDIIAAHENYNINVITAGHFETEVPVLPEIKRAVIAQFPNTRIDYFVSDYDGLI